MQVKRETRRKFLMGVEPTGLAKTIDAFDLRTKLDANAKKLVKHRIILAWILKECVSEFKDLDVSYIEKNCFNDCDLITTVILPRSVKNIEEYAFKSCEDLEYVYIPESCKKIGNQAFDYCDELTFFTASALNLIVSPTMGCCTFLNAALLMPSTGEGTWISKR